LYSPEGSDLLARSLESLETFLSLLAERMVASAREANEAGIAIAQVVAWALNGEDSRYAFAILGSLVLVLAWGGVLEWAVRRTLGLSAILAEVGVTTSARRAGLDAFRCFAIETFTILACQATAVVSFFALFRGHQPERRIVLTYVAALAIVRLVTVASQLVLGPRSPLRPYVPISGRGAEALRPQVLIAAIFAVFGFASATLLRLAGVSNGAVNFLLLAPYGAFFATIVVMVMTMRKHGRQSSNTSARRALPVVPLVYVALIFFMGQFALLLGHRNIVFSVLGSLFLALLVALTDGWLKGTASTNFGSGVTRPADGAVLTGRKPIARTVLYLTAVLSLAWLWGIDVLGLLEGWVGFATAQSLIQFVVTVTVALLAWELVKASIEQRIAQDIAVATREVGNGEGGVTSTSRMATVLPLLRKVVLTVIVTLAGMTALSAIGIDVAPLLAGAGVAGIAIGFGAQSLVQDVVSGAFFLFDDAFRMGEYVEIGQDRGRVEHLSIRSLRLRHHRGALVTVPFGEIKTLTNHSRDWAIVKLLFRLSFGTDPAKVKKIVKRVSAELMDHPEYGRMFLEPLKSQGIRGMDESGVVVSVKFMARPGEQFQLRREAYQRLLAAFDLAGISLARPQFLLQVPGNAPEELDSGASALGAPVAAGQTASS